MVLTLELDTGRSLPSEPPPLPSSFCHCRSGHSIHRLCFLPSSAFLGRPAEIYTSRVTDLKSKTMVTILYYRTSDAPRQSHFSLAQVTPSIVVSGWLSLVLFYLPLKLSWDWSPEAPCFQDQNPLFSPQFHWSLCSKCLCWLLS